jgi:hypothetical protein
MCFRAAGAGAEGHCRLKCSSASTTYYSRRELGTLFAPVQRRSRCGAQRLSRKAWHPQQWQGCATARSAALCKQLRRCNRKRCAAVVRLHLTRMPAVAQKVVKVADSSRTLAVFNRSSQADSFGPTPLDRPLRNPLQPSTLSPSALNSQPVRRAFCRTASGRGELHESRGRRNPSAASGRHLPVLGVTGSRSCISAGNCTGASGSNAPSQQQGRTMSEGLLPVGKSGQGTNSALPVLGGSCLSRA